VRGGAAAAAAARANQPRIAARVTLRRKSPTAVVEATRNGGHKVGGSVPKFRSTLSTAQLISRCFIRARRLLVIKRLNHREPRRRDTASFLMFAVVGRPSCVHEARRCLRATNRHGASLVNTCMREVSVGRRGLSGNGTGAGRRAGGRARPRIGINKPVSELISVSAARDVTRLIEIGTCYTSSHTDDDAPLAGAAA
jgi:hypothetical protein